MRTRRLAAVLAAGALALSGCSFKGASSFHLPGGASGPFKVRVEFKDVLDLVPQSAVKVNDVTVGSVSKIELKHDAAQGFYALVTCDVKKDVRLPQNTFARLRQTSLLGEKFVSLEPPEQKAQWEGSFHSGDTITLASGRTAENADIEEVLGALSLVLNGGSLEQLNTINAELNKALTGRESQVRDFLTQLTGFVKGLDAQKTQITAALDGLDRLTGKLAAQKQVLDVALRDLPKGTAVLADERAQLTKMLTGLNNLGTVATRVIQSTRANTVADLQSLQPILTQLAKAGNDLPNALELLTTYPFPRTIGPGTYRGKKIQGGIRGDYANLFISVDADIVGTIGNLTGVQLPPQPLTTPKTKDGKPVINLPKLPVVSSKATPVPPAVRDLTERMADGRQTSLELLLFGGFA
jgi:phospholipid/cholesterol/gamma-HCH transport system substrate-binding protein